MKIVMTAISIFCFLFSINVFAQNTTYYNYSNGISGSSMQIGNTTYHNFSNGLSGTSTKIGSTTYYNYNNGVSGNSQQIGNTTYHNFSNGVTGSTNQIGNTTYHNFSNGLTGTSTRIGSTTYNNFTMPSSSNSNLYRYDIRPGYGNNNRYNITSTARPIYGGISSRTYPTYNYRSR